MCLFRSCRVNDGERDKLDDGDLCPEHFSLPRDFLLTITHKCNLRCKMCTQYGGTYKNLHSRDLPVSYWIELIETVSWLRPSFSIFGGEPLLYHNLLPLVNAIGRTRCTATISTNGYLLADILDDLVRNRIHIVISIDGPEAIHNSVRKSCHSFERIWLALEKLNDMRRRGADVTWAVNTVLLPENIEYIIGFLEEIFPYEPEWVCLQHLQWSTPRLHRMMQTVWRLYFREDFCASLFPRQCPNIDNDYVKLLCKNIRRIANKLSHSERVFFFPNLGPDEVPFYYSNLTHQQLRPGQSCKKPWVNPSIEPNGDVLLCVDYPVGNITESDFWSIWRGARARNFRAAASEAGRFPLCTRCCSFYRQETFDDDDAIQ